MLKPKVVVILGQTATGKSSLAVKIAKKINGEIISADSRQIYKGLNIGTGKITEEEMRGVPHHLLDIVNPRVRFSVSQYKKLAEEKIEEILTRNKTPIICGGTGFYIDAITKGIIFPEVPPNLKLQKYLAQKSASELFKMLGKMDKRRAREIDFKNKVRMIRAIEIVNALGKVPKILKVQPKYKFIKIGLFLPHDELKLKVKRRVKQMFREGLLSEIKKMKKSGVSDKRLQELGFEYDKPSYEKVIKETLKFTKRQMTWFKRDEEIKWFKTEQHRAIAEYISNKFIKIP